MIPQTEKEIDLFIMLLEMVQIKKRADENYAYMNEQTRESYRQQLKQMKEEYLMKMAETTL